MCIYSSKTFAFILCGMHSTPNKQYPSTNTANHNSRLNNYIVWNASEHHMLVHIWTYAYNGVALHTHWRSAPSPIALTLPLSASFSSSIYSWLEQRLCLWHSTTALCQGSIDGVPNVLYVVRLLLTNYMQPNWANISTDILYLIGHIMLPNKSFDFQFKRAYFIANITFSFSESKHCRSYSN